LSTEPARAHIERTVHTAVHQHIATGELGPPGHLGGVGELDVSACGHQVAADRALQRDVATGRAHVVTHRGAHIDRATEQQGVVGHRLIHHHTPAHSRKVAIHRCRRPHR